MNGFVRGLKSVGAPTSKVLLEVRECVTSMKKTVEVHEHSQTETASEVIA